MNGKLKNESDLSDNHAEYEHPDPIKESHPKKTFDPHIYEEVSPPISSFEDECVTKVAMEENIYAEIKSDTTKGLIVRLRDSIFRGLARLTPWWLARRHFWRKANRGND